MFKFKMFSKAGAVVAAFATFFSILATQVEAVNLTGKWIGTQICPGTGDFGPFLDQSEGNSPIFILDDGSGRLRAYMTFFATPYYGIFPNGGCEGTRQFSLATCPGTNALKKDAFIEIVVATLVDDDTFIATSSVMGNAEVSTEGQPVGNLVQTCVYSYKRANSRNPLNNGYTTAGSCGLLPK